MRWPSIAWLVLLTAAPAAAQPVVTSAGPEGVAVTVYRAEDRDADSEMNLDWLGGYALVTERRTVTIPAGRAVIRFEGVAGGLLPESAIVTGLPAGAREKNLDADLLSPRSLFARSWGRPVILRRTDRNTGAVREERAVIRSGPDGAAILQTRDGFEAINCGPLFEQPIYEGIPTGLSPRPTLSIETESLVPATVTLNLSYLAWGFDWQANYVVRMREGGKRADLTAWVTLANSDPTSFADAEMSVVAGKVNREDSGGPASSREPQQLVLRCFFRSLAKPLPPPAPDAVYVEDLAEIVVTGTRASLQRAVAAPVMMVGEDLGDLKLYRMPIPTTVASNAQKQVAMYVKPRVKAAIVYFGSIDADSPDSGSIEKGLRFRNRKPDGLGVPLPAGRVTVFEPLADTVALSGVGSTDDKAVDEDVDIRLGNAEGVVQTGTGGRDSRGYSVTISNAHPWPVRFEGSLYYDEASYRLGKPSARLDRKNGRPLWAVRVPANGSVTLRYRLARIERP
jgi:hypothetical protein